MQFGIISEGTTDQIVLENILFGFFEDKNLPVDPLQPKPGEAGNWDKVFKYCASEDFREALTSEYRMDYLIVQIDVDFMRRQDVPDEYRFDPAQLSLENIANQMRQKLVDAIGAEFYEEHSQRIIFAIAVDSIECWFLPIYFPSKPKISGKTTNCLQTLNPVLQAKEGFSIHAKNEKYYRIISKYFQKKRDLTAFSQKNASLGWFLAELESKVLSPLP